MKLCGKNIYLFGFLVVLCIDLYFMASGWNGSLLEHHPFRQTQTAISVFYMLKGGSLLGYQTPVFGPPWTIPFEFPFYQGSVFLLVKLSGYPLDQAGRLVSIFFFLTLLYPVYYLARPFFAHRSRIFILLILLCISPQYLYWSRTFMIESAALSLSVWYLFFIRKYLDIGDSSRYRTLVLTGVFVVGGIASVTKVTTFFVYYLIGLFFVLRVLLHEFDGKNLLGILRRRSLLLLVAFILPLIAIVVWTGYCDNLKSLSAYGSMITSAGLKKWNFGTMARKLNVETWRTIFNRSTADLFGNAWMILFMVLPLPFCRKRTVIAVFSLILFYLLPMAVFTNLFFVHNYYIYANGLLLLLPLALVLGDIGEKGVIGTSFCISALLIFTYCSYNHYTKNYLPLQGINYRYDDIKQAVDKNTKPEDVLIISGADWSSQLPYYLQRRAVMLRKERRYSPRFQTTKTSLAGYGIGAVAICNELRSDPDIAGEMIADFLNSSEGVRKMSFEICDFYFGEKTNL